MPISSLKADFTNFPAGTKVTVGSILFGMLDLPEEVAAAAAAPGSSGEQLQTQAAASPAAAVANGGGSESTSSSKPKSKPKPKPKPAAGGQEVGGDPFSRIEMRVGRIVKVGRERSGLQGGNLSVGCLPFLGRCLASSGVTVHTWGCTMRVC